MTKPFVPSARRALTAQQRTIIKVAVARIFPTTDTPGALEAGADDYIDISLAGAYAGDLPIYRKGCSALNRCAHVRYGKAFAKLSERQIDTLLGGFERGKVAEFPQATKFFMTLWRHTMEGVFGEPSYGGNRDMVGWRLVGFPGQRAGYENVLWDQPVGLDPESLPSGAFDPSEQLR